MLQLLTFGAFQPSILAIGNQDVRTVCFDHIKQLSLIPSGEGQNDVRYLDFHATAPR